MFIWITDDNESKSNTSSMYDDFIWPLHYTQFL